MSMLRAHHHARRVLWCALRFTFPPNPPTQSMTFVGLRVFIAGSGGHRLSLSLKPWFLDPKPWSLNPNPWFLDPKPWILNPKHGS